MPRLLQNRYLQARFDDSTGALIAMSPAGSNENLIQKTGCRFFNATAKTWVSEDPDFATADRDETVTAFASIEVIEPSETAISSRLRTKELVIERRYTLSPESPLLSLSLTVARGECGDTVTTPHLPEFHFADTFTDAFLEERDLYFDGMELAPGKELPCWRVFFTEGDDGLLIATRSKAMMGHLRVFEHSIAFDPEHNLAYSSNYNLVGSPILGEGEERQTLEVEIGPWHQERHNAIVEAAKLREPVSVGFTPPTGTPIEPADGTLIPASALFDATGRQAEVGWTLVDQPWCATGQALLATDAKAAPLRIAPDLTGIYRIYIGTSNGNGLSLRFDGDELWTYRMANRTAVTSIFTPILSGTHEADEILFKTVPMDGRTLELAPLANRHLRTLVNYVRFEKLSDEEAAAWQARDAKEPCLLLAGFNDVPDITKFTDPVDPNPKAYRANLWEHANCKVRRVYWRIDNQCSDFPTQIGTMRYVCARTHGLYNPNGKGYGRALKKVDMLRLAVDAARDFDLELYGWMRFNFYGGNVQSDFFKENPQFHEEHESGYEANKLCLAHPEVRQHKIDILVEAAQYGLAGLNLGFLRHPPVFEYAPILVEGFEKEYGCLPPRCETTQDYRCVLPPDDEEYRRWYAYRARFLTAFVRDLRAALNEAGCGKTKLSLWVRANHCLYDGIDLPLWLEEGLCDEVVAGTYCDAELCEPTAEWQRMVQARVPLLRDVTAFRYEAARDAVPGILERGYDGLCTYESDYAVLDDRFIQLYHELRR
ncbi:MAG: glycoside hydrolase family 10 protein [Planctomycetota bacterium]|jgi:hypothetical protein